MQIIKAVKAKLCHEINNKAHFYRLQKAKLAAFTHQIEEFAVIFGGFEFINNKVHRLNIVHIGQ
jgi:hypothetical protein